MPIKPMIPQSILVKCECPYKGAIKPGDIFAWEPNLPHARELVVVVRIDEGGTWREPRIWTRRIDDDEEHFNDESRFREAVVPTLMRPHSPKR